MLSVKRKYNKQQQAHLQRCEDDLLVLVLQQLRATLLQQAVDDLLALIERPQRQALLGELLLSDALRVAFARLQELELACAVLLVLALLLLSGCKATNEVRSCRVQLRVIALEYSKQTRLRRKHQKANFVTQRTA
jgi:hypothetical protein